jgi:3-methyladenine DNA glycosylase AlkD
MLSTVHKEIISQLEALSNTGNKSQSSSSYTGSRHFFYVVPVPKRRALIKAVIINREAKELLLLSDALFKGKSHEEKTMGAMILTYHKDVRQLCDFHTLDSWLNELVGWAEIDAFCYNTFSPEELLADLKPWKQFICALAHDANINKRRAALVFLTHPTARSNDERIHALAFKLILQLAPEKDILITKAISWLLRSQIDTKKNEVADFIKMHESKLPKIAVRETRRKILTGKKNK